ncbi:N-acetylmuramoyl-L-alanine amidase [Desulfosporosinus sp.]|uniref:N-acetylmuramoyl-L-alanine amidase n=1 Tax=Desulfosporosinus sp. TaxID=157907 RepID=UPI0025B8EAEA|nr:N-acetylmuramoyl-L-alanine amidase [Desulfosporosinus sp.]MBC2723321.1 N-acetylmuramoyl-L-alanine amidase [Desulfosporosinus sp.]MBC2726241.1 N-acetylmuramoyl-L-alanine amidase [Desulfosporosinus sp.]
MTKPSIKWIGSPNHSAASKKLKTIAIVDHIMQGSLAGTDSWFKNPASKASSHFGVGKNGDIHQYVGLDYPAWANGAVNKPDWPLYTGVNPNYYTVSIEHEGYTGDVMPEAQYQATLALHRWLIELLGIPVTRDTIIGHYRIDSVNKANCPGSGFPWERLFRDLEGGEDVLDVAVLLNTKDDFWAGADVAARHGNCGIFIRPADRSVPKDAMSAKRLILVGGPTTGHPSEVLLSGHDKYGTAAEVKKHLG